MSAKSGGSKSEGRIEALARVLAERHAERAETESDFLAARRKLKEALETEELLKTVPSIGSSELVAELALPLLEFAKARALLTGLSRAEEPAPTKGERVEAHRNYFETRNELLFRAVRIHQRKFPILQDGTRGKEYQDLLDRLFKNFITDECFAISKTIHAPADTAYSLAFDPELLREFKSNVRTFYVDKELKGTPERKALMERILVPDEDLQQLETPLTTAESRALREARLAYASSKIAAAEGVPHIDARAIEKRYRDLCADALAQIKRMKESTEEDNDWVDELAYKAKRADMQLEIALIATKLSPEKQKRAGKLGAKLSKMKWGRNTLALLAIFAAVSKDAPDVDVTPMRGPAPSGDQRQPDAQVPTERADESSASVSIAILEGRNALSALKDVVIASNRISWITPWMETVRQNARPDLAVTREGRLEALAMNLGFMTDYTHFDQRTGTYTADSLPIPKGSTLVLDESGMRLIYNGREEQLVTVTESPEGNIITVHPYVGMRP